MSEHSVEPLALIPKGFGFLKTIRPGEPIFLVSAGVSTKEALDHASDLLQAAERIVGGLEQHLDATEQGQAEAAEYLIEAAKAIVDAAVASIGVEERRSTTA